MDNGIYSLLAGTVGEFNNINTIANNTANTNTAGYKNDTVLFQSYLNKDVLDDVAMPNDITNVINMKQGSVKQTGRMLDLFINGAGFFMVQTPSGVRYTRAGNFHLNNEYVLTTSNGYPVLSTNGDNITFASMDEKIMIDASGNIQVEVKQNGDVATVEPRGSIGVVQFENPKLMRKSFDSLMATDQEPQEAINIRVLQGAIEESNVQPVLEMQRLIEVQRKFQGESNLINNTYKLQKTAYDVMAKQGN